MNNRARVRALLHGEKPDRYPAVHFGYWHELLAEWAEQGHIRKDLVAEWTDGNAADRELDAKIGWDFNWQTMKSGNTGLMPTFEPKVIEILPDGFKRVQNIYGLIERVRDGADSIPAEDDYLLKDRAAYEAFYRDKIQFHPERINYTYFEKEFNQRSDDVPVGLHLGSVLGEIRNMLSVIGMSYLLYDDEELFAELVDTYAEMQYQCAEEVLKTGAKFDFAHYWEDICFKNGPLISPELFEKYCAKHYRTRNDLCNRYGIDIISLDCDGVTEKLQPIWFENGVNTLFPIEVGTWGDQFTPAKRKFGKTLRGVGGVDKTVLRKDKAAVDAEIERIRGLCALGEYIPCPDHRLMPGTKWDLVLYYVERIKSLPLE